MVMPHFVGIWLHFSVDIKVVLFYRVICVCIADNLLIGCTELRNCPACHFQYLNVLIFTFVI